MNRTLSPHKVLYENRTRFTAIMLASVVVLIFTWNWLHIVNHTPAVIIPTPVMPKVNAYDTYLKAASAMQDLPTLDWTVFNGRGSRRWQLPTYGVRKRLDEKNAAALALIRAGLQQTYRLPPVRSFQDGVPTMKFRQLARLLALDESVRAESGDWYGALNSRLDQIAFSEDLCHGAGITGLLVGAACEKCHLPYSGDLVEHLNLQESRGAIDRLEKILSQRCPLSEMLIEEKWAGVSSMDAMFRDEKWQDRLGSSGSGRLDEIQNKAKLMMVDTRTVLRDYMRYLDQCSQIARAPLYRRAAFPAMPADPINQLFALDSKGVQQTDAQEESANKLFLIKMALHAYNLEHGRYPKQLSDLTPGYISRIPENPLGANGQFSYQISGGAYLLFNAGSTPAAATKPLVSTRGSRN